MVKQRLLSEKLTQPLVLVGIMGAGKTSVGKGLAAHLGLPFVDSDDEIEKAAHMSISEIFEHLDEPAFRDGERKVIARLLEEGPMVLSTGGGAFMNEETRQLIKDKALSLWLHAGLDILVQRVGKSTTRPLLQKGEPEEILRDLCEKRGPFYAQADLSVKTDNRPLRETIDHVMNALENYLDKKDF